MMGFIYFLRCQTFAPHRERGEWFRLVPEIAEVIANGLPEDEATDPRGFDDVFLAFGGPAKLASAIGIPPFHAQTMKTRNSIPPGYWPRVVAAAHEIGIRRISFEALAQIAAAKREDVA